MTTLCNEFWKNKLTRIASRTLASKCARTLCAQFYQVQIFRVACVMVVVQEGGVCKTWRSINQRWRWSAAVLICKKKLVSAAFNTSKTRTTCIRHFVDCSYWWWKAEKGARVRVSEVRENGGFFLFGKIQHGGSNVWRSMAEDGRVEFGAKRAITANELLTKRRFK